ncbi:hypothetical protein [Streptomyces sp. Isolate_45]|nr:hypothetical protein [Streptomyces sp. Isolate_45]MDA5283689.1 hypothetical protein [Streptomyces sp. Isolate_45]
MLSRGGEVPALRETESPDLAAAGAYEWGLAALIQYAPQVL